ncbi:6734_t:CDS:1 [Dentiscutata erythropus]|uniref:6734_t:CDS:1 n=1 Tax=Dentiscutata erythropus TaxID=1348616 RepID=A0A9N9N8P2_9GLOM|nr:6734_t:CDS:1 [Dentiscutata erythropus]
MLEHSQYIKYFNYFQCKCRKKIREFYPHRWQYDNRHDDNNCPFFKRCNYFKVLQTVDPEKKYQKEEKLGCLNQKGSLMRFKNYFRIYKLDYNIFFWVKNFKDTDFKQYIFRKGKKKKLEKIIKDVDILVSNHITQIEEYKLKSPEYQHNLLLFSLY